MSSRVSLTFSKRDEQKRKVPFSVSYKPYSNFGLRAIALLCGMVHGVVVQMMTFEPCWEFVFAIKDIESDV